MYVYVQILVFIRPTTIIYIVLFSSPQFLRASAPRPSFHPPVVSMDCNILFLLLLAAQHFPFGTVIIIYLSTYFFPHAWTAVLSVIVFFFSFFYFFYFSSHPSTTWYANAARSNISIPTDDGCGEKLFYFFFPPKVGKYFSLFFSFLKSLLFSSSNIDIFMFRNRFFATEKGKKTRKGENSR